MSNILYTVATDNYGRLIKANRADKGNDYYCPVCTGQLILRKSGKTGKGTKRPHFAHKTLTPNCTPETALHFAFKNLLANKIETHIKSNTPVLFSWECGFCNIQHSGDLLKKAKCVKLEHNMTVCKPDIALLDEDQNVYCVIEVVVTNKPEDRVLEYYSNNNISVIQIYLSSDKDIDELEDRVSNPASVSICINPKCQDCGKYQSKKILTVIDGSCPRCNHILKIANFHTSDGKYRNHLPGKFKPEELVLAKSKGITLSMQYSKTARRKYLANTCPKCRAFIGEHFLFTNYICLAAYGDLVYNDFELGYYCDCRG